MPWRTPLPSRKTFSDTLPGRAAVATDERNGSAVAPQVAAPMQRDTSVVAETITFRPDEDAGRALAVLTRDGTSVSTAVRAALSEAARTAAQGRLRSEAAAPAADDADRAEAAQVLRDMETPRAW
jgi:hypothetical protein